MGKGTKHLAGLRKSNGDKWGGQHIYRTGDGAAARQAAAAQRPIPGMAPQSKPVAFSSSRPRDRHVLSAVMNVKRTSSPANPWKVPQQPPQQSTKHLQPQTGHRPQPAFGYHHHNHNQQPTILRFQTTAQPSKPQTQAQTVTSNNSTTRPLPFSALSIQSQESPNEDASPTSPPSPPQPAEPQFDEWQIIPPKSKRRGANNKKSPTNSQQSRHKSSVPGLPKSVQQRRRKKSKKQGWSEEQDDFMCPISLDLMWDPVILVDRSGLDGQTYSRKALERWLDHKLTSPLFNQELTQPVRLVENVDLRKKIHSWRSGQGR